MRSIVQQTQQDPQSMMQHMQNPDVRAKVEKLIKAVSGACSSHAEHR